MKLKHIYEIVSALLLARSKQTIVAIIGVTFSIAFFVCLLGFMEGLNDLLDGLVMNRTAHVRLYNNIKPSKSQPIDLSKKYSSYHNFVNSIKPEKNQIAIYDVEKVANTIMKDPRVKGIAPKIATQVFYSLGNINLNGVIHGIDVEKEAKFYAFSDYVHKGNYNDLKTYPNSIILGKGAANKMLANIGDNIIITTYNGDQFSFKIAGFFESGIAELDKVQSFTSIATAQKVLGKNSKYISELNIKLYDMNIAPMVAKEYEKIFDIDAEDIQTANAQFETGSSVRSIISYAVGITLLIVSGFGIYNILNMLIYEKMDTIAILKATGFSGRDVKTIFLAISLTIGFSGGIVGLIFGLILSKGIDAIPFNNEAMPNVLTYPVNYGIEYYIIAFSFALITTYLAGYFPAKKASKIDPVLIIRGK